MTAQRSIVVPVPSLTEAVAFYVGQLGFRVRSRTSSTAMVVSADQGLTLDLVLVPAPATVDLYVEKRERLVADVLLGCGTVEGDWIGLPEDHDVVCTDPFGNTLLVRKRADEGIVS